jgi:hypothetical protein
MFGARGAVMTSNSTDLEEVFRDDREKVLQQNLRGRQGPGTKNGYVARHISSPFPAALSSQGTTTRKRLRACFAISVSGSSAAPAPLGVTRAAIGEGPRPLTG